MPGLTQQQRNNYNNQSSNDDNNAFCTTNAFWSKHRDDISFNHLQKFWSDLSPQARQDLLKVDKQTILEQARKNMYCSRCNGLLLEGFMQIVMYGKSLPPNGTGGFIFGRRHVGLKNHNDSVPALLNGSHNDDSQDPAVHPWGGLTTAKDGTLTVLSTYIYSKSLKGLQNVFDSARARERERELLYPDACGGGGRGWISQGIASYGRGHGTRETCALHTARLSCDTLVDFWSALGEETRHSLLRMKEEDFIERLMYRFDSKRFCRDCRKNVIREFKELKELKRIKREPRCTNRFCVADSVFQYEVSDDAIRADWRQTFMDSSGAYHHFEWAVGTGEGKADILEFENVGLNKTVNVTGLDLGGLSACYVTLRAWKRDGRCTELCVKAHALKGQQCVHSRLVVGDGYVSINRGESIRRFFERAEEAEEEEDDDTMDKDGNELDGECTRPQKHAKSPELAREFLLDAATVIFKEQVEKAFREGTARQNAHSIFVCLVLKLLEERVHVACKEIITLEKQTKLLEEEEKEKREEEERKERRRMKEREKKLRRKERLKEKDKDKGVISPDEITVPNQESKEEPSSYDDEENNRVDGEESIFESTTVRPVSPDLQEEVSSEWYYSSESRDHYHGFATDSGDYCSEYSEVSFLGDKQWKDDVSDSASKWSDRHRSGHVYENGYTYGKSESRLHSDHFEAYSRKAPTRQFRANGMKSQSRNCATKHVGEKFHSSNSRMGERFNSSCSCNYILDYRTTNGSKVVARSGWEPKKVWEPMDSQKKYPRRNSESDVTLVSSAAKVDGSDTSKVYSPSKTDCCSDDISDTAIDTHLSKDEDCDDGVDSRMRSPDHSMGMLDNQVDSPLIATPLNDSCDAAVGSDSNSEKCYSTISEGDSNLTSSNTQTLETTNSSDSEDASQQSDNQENSHCVSSEFTGCIDNRSETTPVMNSAEICNSDRSSVTQLDFGMYNHPVSSPANGTVNSANSYLGSEPQVGLMSPHPPNQNLHYPMFHQAPSSIGYYHPSTIIWPAPPTNGLIAMPRLNPYVISSPVNYGWNGNPGLCMSYGSLPHLEPPLLNHGQVPVYRPVTEVNSLYTEEQLKTPTKPTLAQETAAVHIHNKPVIVSAGVRLDEPPNGRTMKKHADPPQVHTGKENNNGFSLFHFGGPVALASTLKNGHIEDFSLNNNSAHAEVDNLCSKKEAATIEEYSLFAANNGFQFSF